MLKRVMIAGLGISLCLSATNLAAADVPAKEATPAVRQADAPAQPQTVPAGVAREPGKVEGVPHRDPSADSKLIDLTNYYTLGLNEDASGAFGYTLSSLPKGVQRLGNTDYDLRGIVQVSGQQFVTSNKEFPEVVKGIRVRLKCEKLSFLQATHWSEDKGVQIGTYVIHYISGDKVEIPIRYGIDLRDWIFRQNPATPAKPGAQPSMPIALWTGKDKDKPTVDYLLFEKKWTNPRPDLEIVSIDLVSAMTNAAPFLVAVTAQ
ncbi:MAG TPA: hypothetical protein VH370_12120 [Humisphaera sp.]|jgi:hypothetical protein|nr:hypothetical protein [Humisphaera sp.]